MTTPAPDVAAARLALMRGGYSPIPVEGKVPVLKAWEKKIETNSEEITLWGKVYNRATNTGALTRKMPGIDIDLRDADAVAAVVELARETFEEHGYVMVRTGEAPKCAIPLRTNEPFKKLVANVTAPNGKSEKIEILCDGQQLVMFGIHPDTQKPYSWHGGDPATIKLEQLPYVSSEQAQAFLAAATELLIRDFGYTRAAERPRANGDARDGGGPADWQSFCDQIRAGVELHENLLRLAAKLVVSGMTGGAATNFLRGLMGPPGPERDARWNERFNDIPRLVSSAEKFRTAAVDRDGGPTGAEIAEQLLRAEEEARPVNGSGIRRKLISATPFVWRDPKLIPPRQWLYGHHLIRKFGSATIALGGIGKSSQLIVEALAMVTKRNLLGVMPTQRCKVWLWNGEDPLEEIERRIAAACLHYGITPLEIAGGLFVDSGRDSEIVIATQTRDGAKIAIPTVEALVRTIHDNQIDAVQIDPFISSHQVTENDNNAIDLVAKKWTWIADITNNAIELSHHARKTGGAETTVEDGRGAVALLNAVRSARVLNTMTAEEGRSAGVINHRRYFKLANGKLNLAPAPDKVDWFHMVSVELGNGPPNNPDDGGDKIGVVTAWQWPNPLDGVTGKDFDKVAAVIRAGEWRENSQAQAWVGYAVAKALGLDPADKADKAKIRGLLKIWIGMGSLVVVPRLDHRRVEKVFVEVAPEGEGNILSGL